MRILLIEDSSRVAEAVGAGLRQGGHVVVVAGSVHAAEDAAGREHFDAAVVDIGLPDGSGLAWCRATRKSGGDLPVLLLTARTGVADRVAGLDAGADDYLAKPFAMEELLARVRAMSRREPRWTESVRTYGLLIVDRDRRTVHVRSECLALTPREFDVIALLAWRDGRVVPKGEILECVWGDTSERAGSSLEVLLVRIRRKLGEHGMAGAVRTVRQVGYAWALERSKHG